MKRLSLFSAMLVAFAQTAWAGDLIPLDADWKFFQGNARDAEQSEFDDAPWQTVRLPHDWAIAGPFDQDNPSSKEGAFLPTGVGWYRKHFSLPDSHEGKRVFVEFDGVMANSEVWLNGQHLGRRPNGYVSFRYDLTDHLRADNHNVLAVRTDTSQQVASRWYTGSGIYRHVRLEIVDPLHVDQWGVFVTTPEITAEQATIEVATEVINQSDAARDFMLRTEIVDPQGASVASVETSGTADRQVNNKFQQTLEIPNPTLWDILAPVLYTAKTSILENGEVVDAVENQFGIRHFQFKSDTGFWLNGRNFKLKGVCLHHCGGAVGAAVPQDVWRRRLARLQSLGVNAIRTAHNPVDPEFLDTCDVMGILVMDEFFDCWTIAKRKYDYHLNFDEWSHRDLADTIRRDRNHPSIVLYSVGNEIHDTPKAELAKRILKGLVEVCHETDPTRPVTQGLFRPNVSHDYDNGLADLLDVIGTNYRDGELLQAWRDNPERKIVGTEQRHELSTWLNCRDYPQHAGQFLWVGIDYLGESPKWPVTCFNAGLLDRAGFVQPRGVQRQSWWSDVPMVAAFRRIARTPDAPVDPGYEVIEWDRRQVLFPDWNPHKESPGEQNVEVYSNCDSVELLLNGKSLGKKTRPEDDSPRNWKVAYEPGALVAVGSNGGTQVCRDQLRTAGEPAKLLLTADRETLPASWENVAHVEVTVADVDGVRSPRSDNLLEFQVEGPGKILAVDNGSVSSHESFQGAQRTAFHGRCLVILQAASDAGEITLTVSSEGLTPATVKIAAAGSL